MKSHRKYGLAAATLAIGILGIPGVAHAYIGPGAGFAFAGSFLILFVTVLLAIGVMLVWPIRLVFRLLRGRNVGRTGVEKVVVLGLDGLCPVRCRRMMAEGKLPNLRKLAEEGCFHDFTSTNPSMSPVAWSTFSTGVDPSRHGIFDFFTRHKRSYQPILSSADIGSPTRVLKIGKYRIPLGGAKIRLLRRAVPFWKYLGQHGIPSTVLRVPITFPPEKYRGLSLSAMCTPDLRGSQGTFTFFTTRHDPDPHHTQGVQITLERKGNRLHAEIPGPENPLLEGNPVMEVPIEIEVDAAGEKAHVRIRRERFTLEGTTYSPWIPLEFKPGLGKKVHAIARFCVRRYEPEFELYMTPINIDPASPVLPISHPKTYAMYLAKMLGPYATLGLAEDTWALNARVLDEASWLEQAWAIHDEREKMWFHTLDMTRKGFAGVVFDGTDRIQHMFMRYEYPDHPSNRDKDTVAHRDTIEHLYERSDEVVGRTMKYVNDKTVLIVISDHGFTHFSWGVNLNSWLLREGYLFLKEGCTRSGEWFENIDWTRTKVFQLGLTGIFINRKGREGAGIVAPGEELESLKKELVEKLTGLVDERNGQIAIHRIFDTSKFYDGPFLDDAPDFIIGYEKGYRASWEAAVGIVDDDVFVDNTKSWSGDHCLDFEKVPGIFFSNRKIEFDDPHIMDIGPTVLRLFGVPLPRHMTGKALFDGMPPAPAAPAKKEERKEVSVPAS